MLIETAIKLAQLYGIEVNNAGIHLIKDAQGNCRPLSNEDLKKMCNFEGGEENA